MSRRFGSVALTSWVIAACLVFAVSAHAAFPGKNGKIAFVHLSGAPGSSQDIFAMSATGRNRTHLTDTPGDDAFPSYSPDGERIVFSRGPAGSAGFGQIWVMKHDGSRETRLTDGPPTAETPTFSPDGTRILFTVGNQIWIMNADGTGETQLTFPGSDGDHAHGATFSSDGEEIAFSHFDGTVGYHDISVMNPDGSGRTALTTPSAATDDYNPDFSPDGRRIVFDRYDQTQDDLFVMKADGSGEAALTSGAGRLDLLPEFAPDGTKVLFERDSPGFTFANVVTVNSRGLNQGTTPLTNNDAPVQDFEPGWQPLNPPSCNLKGKAVSKSVKRRVRVTVRCGNEDAKVTAKGSGKAPKARAATLASKATTFKIPAVTAQAAVDERTKIVLRVSRKGRKALRKAAKAGKRGRATIIAKFTDDLGQSSRDSLRVKFKAK